MAGRALSFSDEGVYEVLSVRNSSEHNPFWHLASDGFWHLQLKEEPKEKVTPTKTWLKENVLYASFDDDMWVLLQNREYRNKMRNVIIDLINSQRAR